MRANSLLRLQLFGVQLLAIRNYAAKRKPLEAREHGGHIALTARRIDQLAIYGPAGT
jgi:hypothetical protein